MPGIFGFFGSSIADHNDNLLSRMARALEHEDWFKVETYKEPLLGLGRVTLGIANSDPQPIWNEDESICVMMEGELYDYQKQKQSLLEAGHIFRHHNDAEFLLHLYEENSNNFAIQLNGAFIAAIWDKKHNRVMLVNDRLGLYPFYYVHIGNSLLFASGVRALLVEPRIPCQIDRVAIAEFLSFDHILHDHTLLQAVRLLPPASILIFGDQGLEIRSYWRAKHPDSYILRDEVELMEEFLYLTRQAVTRQKAHDSLPSAILLSGGLDSRLLLAYLVENGDHSRISSFTWGIPGCDDIRYASQISRLLGTRHYSFELKPDWLREHAIEAVRITDGMGNLVNLHALATLEAESAISQVLYKGFLGDAMMGFGLRQQHWGNYDERTTTLAHMQVHRDQGLITFDPLQEHEKLFSGSFTKEIGKEVMDDYNAGMRDARTPELADQRIYFDFYQRVPRMTIKGVEAARHRTMVRLPFADNDLVEFSFKVPPGLRYQRRLMKNAIIRGFPNLAQVPVTETGLPMMSCSRDVMMRANQVLRWHLHHAGIKWIAPYSRRPYKDYNNWFRTNLRPWIEDILLSDRFFQRGYYNPDYIRNLVAEHMQGTNHTVRIGALASIELWHRQFID